MGCFKGKPKESQIGKLIQLSLPPIMEADDRRVLEDESFFLGEALGGGTFDDSRSPGLSENPKGHELR